MRIIPSTNTIRKSILLYRLLKYRKGHGVHSPFAYNLMTKVIDERCLYYSFNEIELVRKQLLQDTTLVTYRDRKGRQRTHTIAKAARDEAITPKQGALLFRLCNYFKVKHILQIGSSVGLSTLYLTSYSSQVNCITLEDSSGLAEIARVVYNRMSKAIDLRVGKVEETLSDALQAMEQPDLVYFNINSQPYDVLRLFKQCAGCADTHTIFVVHGIKSDKYMHQCWKSMCVDPKVRVSMDLYHMGLLFFNEKLHPQHYKVYF